MRRLSRRQSVRVCGQKIEFHREVLYLRVAVIFMLFATACILVSAVFSDGISISQNHGERIICVLERKDKESFTCFLNVNETLVDDGVIAGLEDSLRPYPSNSKQVFTMETPAMFTSIFFCAFILICAAFLAYDHIVMHRHDSILRAASRSSKIVESMFPIVVRDRLLKGFEVPQAQRRSSMDLVKSFLNNPTLQETEDDLSLTKRTGPIAVMFPATTIMFADIAGFTSWRSNRHPKEVFHLLESLFMEFDAVAKKLGVFKVETIGDCYVAVAGLPEPQDDHAVIMAEFAMECQKKMEKVKSDLGGLYGLGTEVLSLRAGLHSGPVTAGVLRSEKSRFQLFGDTMNTASRMESTGEPTKVQISQETAACLEAGGKSMWFVPRDELVSVKGKGMMETYWLRSHTSDENNARKMVESSLKNDKDFEINEEMDIYFN